MKVLVFRKYMIGLAGLVYDLIKMEVLVIGKRVSIRSIDVYRLSSKRRRGLRSDWLNA